MNLQRRREQDVKKARMMVKRWQRKTAIANTMLKKWRTRLKTAEKRLGVITLVCGTPGTMLSSGRKFRDSESVEI